MKEEIRKYIQMLNEGYKGIFEWSNTEDLLRICMKQDKEIEKLNKCIKDDKENANEIIVEQQREIERLHSIIKEVREYIENYNIGMPYDHFVKKENLLEILDKGVN